MKEEGKQTFFFNTKNSKRYQEIENLSPKQEEMIEKFLANKIKPTNDLWLAATINLFGKIAQEIEDKNTLKIKELLLKVITQLFIWYDLIEKERFEEASFDNTKIQNPIYNTIALKLFGQISKSTLQNSSSVIQANLRVTISFLEQWLRKTQSTSKQNDFIIPQVNNDFLEEIEDYFKKLEI